MSMIVKNNLEDYNGTPCPRCGLPCDPVKKLKDGSIRFKRHYCDSGFETSAKFREFKVDKNGEPIAPKD